MYGAFSTGSVPYGASGGVEPFDFAAMLESSRDALVYTVEIAAWQTGGEEIIDRTLGTNIGNMTLNGGLAAAFNGTTSQAAASSARAGPSTGYVGKTLAAASPIERAVVHGSSTNGYAFTVNATTTVTLYGKQGAAPSSGTDGMVLGSITFTDTSDESAGRTITSTDAETVWDHVWVYVDCPTEPTAVYIGELVLYRGRQTTIRLGSAEWATAPTDVPASTPFDGRLTTVLQWSRSIVGDRIGIDYTSGEATIAFLNSDGEYDDIVDGYAIDGRAVAVRVGRKTDAFADHLVIFNGVGVDWTADDDTVTITARDLSSLLDVPVQPNTYAGTGGAEGEAALAGKRRPLAIGAAKGFEPTAIDTAILTYQLHDGSIDGVSALLSVVYDRGATLVVAGTNTDYTALAAAVVGAGFVRVSLDGYMKMGAAPDGIVLASATNLGGYATVHAAAAVRMLIDHGTDLVDSNLDLGSFHAVESAQPAAVSFWAGPSDSVTVAEAVGAIMAGVGGWCGFNRDGTLGLGILTAPSGDPVATFERDEGDIIDLNRETLPSGVWPPPWRWRVAYDRIWTTFSDFAGATSAFLNSYFSQYYRLTEASDSGILDDFPSAKDPAPIEAHFDLDTDSQAEADRVLAFFSAGYRLYRMTVGRRGLLLNLGDVITVTWPRYGLDAGKDVVVVGIEDQIDLSDGSGVDTVQLVVFG